MERLQGLPSDGWLDANIVRHVLETHASHVVTYTSKAFERCPSMMQFCVGISRRPC